MTSWLDLSHQLFDEEFGPALKAAGFRKQKYRWTRRRPGGGEDELSVQWSSFNRTEHDSVHFWCVGDARAKTYAMPGFWYVGSDLAQVSSFMNSGHDALAEEILGPLGLLELYREKATSASYSRSCALPREPRDLERLRRLTRWSHRYRWWMPDEVRSTLRHDVQALLVVFERAAYMPLGRELGERVAEALDAKGLERFFVA